MSEADELLAELKAVYGEMNPRRDPERMRVSDDVLALGVLLRREIRAAAPTNAASAGTLRTRTMDKLAKHNPKDAE